jgi:nucleotide-binding universal stress UspA family protein
MPQLTSRLLVGVDTPADSRHLVRVATRLAAALEAELHLVHVRLTRSTVQGRPMTPAQRSTQQAEGERLLAALAEEAVAVGGQVAGQHVRFGDRIEQELVRAQEELAAGLLVVGTSRGGGVARRVLGTPVAGTVRRSPGSVLVVREPAGGPDDIL